MTESLTRYVPSPPIEATDESMYLYTELQRISQVIELLAQGHMDVTHVAPDRPREGDIRYADGTNWNPGSGKGLYLYNGTAWGQL